MKEGKVYETKVPARCSSWPRSEPLGQRGKFTSRAPGFIFFYFKMRFRLLTGIYMEKVFELQACKGTPVIYSTQLTGDGTAWKREWMVPFSVLCSSYSLKFGILELLVYQFRQIVEIFTDRVVVRQWQSLISCICRKRKLRPAVLKRLAWNIFQ